ncbi:hypothetical protein JRQ81_017809 [Phrynocephalus forsythii]|uniref:Uncharacterized protein n=1 Tax=Phrynocephalus forsythii TaxID=171643 RepID=A0A9Q0XUC4_9SAUR|nr:hypothetical protein JRQ81_017809 [Phrynocephalus forsythii]
MARSSKDNDPAIESYEPSSFSCFYPGVTAIHGNVAAQPCNESPTPAANDPQYNYITAKPPYSKPSSRFTEHAKCIDFPATTAAEAETSEDPDGKGEDPYAAGGTDAPGS